MMVIFQGESELMEEEPSYFTCELARGARGFGFSIRGGREFHNMPLYVLRIADMGPAAADGSLKVSCVHDDPCKKFFSG